MTKKRYKRLEKKHRKTKHHIIPQSRGGSNALENICKVDDHEHKQYHNLFVNLEPTEIIEYLVETFWNGNYGPVNEVYERESVRLSTFYNKNNV